MRLCFLVEVLPRESLVELKDSKSRRILVCRIGAKRLCLIPPPYGLGGLVGDQSWRVEMIGVDIVHLCLRFLDRDRNRSRGRGRAGVISGDYREAVAARGKVRDACAVRRARRRADRRCTLEEVNFRDRAVGVGRRGG